MARIFHRQWLSYLSSFLLRGLLCFSPQNVAQRLQNARRWPDSDMTPRAKRRRRRSFKQANVPKAEGGFRPMLAFAVVRCAARSATSFIVFWRRPLHIIKRDSPSCIYVSFTLGLRDFDICVDVRRELF